MENRDLNVFTDEDIVKMAQEGSNTAYEYLIKKYKEVAKNKSKLYFIAGGDNEDVIQEGMIGIFKAIRDFDPEKETSFRTFAELCINRQIINAIKTASRKKHQILTESISMDMEDSEGEQITPLWEKIASEKDSEPENQMLLKELREYYNAAGRKLLSPFECIIWDEMLKGKEYKEIAETIGSSPKAVDNAIQRIKKKFRNLLEE